MKPQVLACFPLTAYLFFVSKVYDKKEFAVCQEAVTGTSRAMEKLGGIKKDCSSSESILLAVSEMQIIALAQQ